MSDLIQRQDAIDTALEFFVEFLGGAFYEDDQKILIKRMNELPPTEPEERTAKVSNQIFNNSNPYIVGAWIGICECGELVSYSSKYCHMCGAKLDWSGNE